MSLIQRFFTAVLPRRMAEEMEAESRRWHIQCSCGWEQSVWEVGGVRWKAKGNPRQKRPCSQCGQTTWQTIYYKE